MIAKEIRDDKLYYHKVPGLIKKYIVFATLFFTVTTINAENFTYAIKLGGFKIGTLNTIHEKKGSIDYYSIISNVEVNLIFKKIKVYYKTVSIYSRVYTE